MTGETELDLIKLSGRLFLGTARDEEALELLHLPLDWSLLLEMASMEGMCGLLATQLERLARVYNLDLPVDPFSRALRGIFVRNGHHFAEISVLREVLQEKAIRIILLKGGALIETTYRRQLGLRPLSDLDLLVKATDIPVIRKALFERGFRAASPSSTFFSNGSVAIDLHTDLIGSTRIRRRALANRIDLDAVWQKATPLDPSDDHLLVLSNSHQFIHLAVHAQKHSFSKMIWFVDLGLVSQQLDWKELIDQAERSDTLRPLAYALMSLEKLMGVKIPPDVRNSLPHLNQMERLFVNAVVRRWELQTFGEVMVVFSIPTWAGRLGYLFEYMFPDRNVLTETFASTPYWLIYPRRLGQITALGLREGIRFLGLLFLELSALLGARQKP